MCLASGDELELIQVNFEYPVSSFTASLTVRSGYMTQFWTIRYKRKLGEEGLWRKFQFSILTVEMIIG